MLSAVAGVECASEGKDKAGCEVVFDFENIHFPVLKAGVPEGVFARKAVAAAAGFAVSRGDGVGPYCGLEEVVGFAACFLEGDERIVREVGGDFKEDLVRECVDVRYCGVRWGSCGAGMLECSYFNVTSVATRMEKGGQRKAAVSSARGCGSHDGGARWWG